MSLADRIRGFREGLNSSVYKRVWEHSPELADILVSDVKLPKSRYSGMSLAGRALAAFLAPATAYVCLVPGCGGGGGGNGGGTPTPPTSYACSNSADDDGDTLVDMADPGCGSATDNDEYNAPANRAPVVDAAFAPVSTPEDNPTAVAGVSPHFSDPDGDALTYSVQGFTNITAALNGNNIDISAPLNWNGTETGSVRACDTSSACVTTPLQVTFTPVNDAPVVTGVTMYAAMEGQNLDGRVNTSDVDGDAVTCTPVNNGGLIGLNVNADCTISSSSPMGYNTSGIYTANVNAFDGTATTNSDITITITNVNRKPVVTDVLMTQAEELKNLTGLVVRTDADGDPTTCEIVSSDISQARVAADGTVYSSNSTPGNPATPDPLAIGTGGNNKSLEVRCTDGFEVSTNFTKNFRVEGYPVLDSALPDQSTPEDSSRVLVIGNFSDPNNDLLSYFVSGLSTISADVSGSQITFSAPANYNGSETANLSACDPTGLCKTDSFLMTFTAVPDAPALNSVTITSAKELAALAGQINATDADIPYGDSLTYSIINDPSGFDIQVNPITGAVFTVAPLLNGSAGSYDVTFRVRDSTLLVSDLVKTINVAVTNVAPVIDNVVITLSNEGYLLAGQITYHDDDGDTVECSKVSSTLPELIVLANGQISSTGPLPREISGTYNYEVACSDGFESDTATGSFDVYDVTAPGVISDLVSQVPAFPPETINFVWTSPGDDGNIGMPGFFEFKYKLCSDQNDCPISEAEWGAASSLGTVTATGDAGFGYSIPFPNIPAGHVCFAGKTTDEAGNTSGISNSPCADVISKAQYFVDFYLPTGRFYLDYDEVQSMMQGDVGNGIPSRALDVGTVMARAPPGTGTPEFFRDYLLSLTNTIYTPWSDIELCGEYVGGTVQSALDWENINTPKRLFLHNRGPPTECSPGYLDPYEFTDSDMQELRTIFREHLIKWVDANQAQYCDLALPCAEGEEWSINH